MKGTAASLALVTALGVTAGPLPAAAAEAERGIVKVVGRLTATPRSGPSGAGAETSVNLDVGVAGSLTLFADDFEGTFGAGTRPPDGRRGMHAWHVSVKPVSVAADAAKLELAWARYDRATGTPRAGVSDRQVVTLRQGQRCVLDLARSPAQDSALVSVLVEVELAYVGDPAFEELSIGHEIWLIHRSPTEAVRRLVAFVAKQGESRPFDFEPIEFAALGSDEAGEGRGLLQLGVDGEIRTRLRRDGTFDVGLKTNRTLDCGAGRIGSGTGVKTLNVTAGEGVEIELPTPSGSCTLPPDVPRVATLPAGLLEVQGRVRVDLGEYFRGTKTSLLLRVRRRPQ